MKRLKFNLAARFICLLMLALLLAQGLTLSISWDERGAALREVAKAEFLSRTASLAKLLDATPAAQRDNILQVSNTAYVRFWIHQGPPSQPSEWWAYARKHLLAPLGSGKAAQLMPTRLRDSLVDLPPEQIDATATWTAPQQPLWPDDRQARFIYLPQFNVMGIATPLQDGTWLRAAYAKPVMESPFGTRALFSLGVTAIALIIIAILVARGISRPLQELAEAAEKLGKGETIEDLPETGPEDIRRTAQAFNRMQWRIRRFVEDRTRMLAAIGHDLRTPLTSLRLRAEFIEDEEIQRKMLGTIEEITTMTEAAIRYAKDNAADEPTRSVELGALVQSLCDDLASMDMAVEFDSGARAVLHCRPDALRRAVRNLIENAVRYGQRAHVQVREDDENLWVDVRDEGQGIAPDEQEKVFAPFYRLEASRNRNTGGVGLGLSIARSIARQHGGDIVLAGEPGAFIASLCLPKT